MEPIAEIQIDLVSNASLNTYPSNTLASFTNDLHTPIKLDGEWEVALIEIFHPTSFEVDQDKVVNISITRDAGGPVKTKKAPFAYKMNEKISDIMTRLDTFFGDLNISYTADPTDHFSPLQDTKPIFTPITIDKSERLTRISPGTVENVGLNGSQKVKILPLFDDPSFLRYMGFDHKEYARDVLKFHKCKAQYSRIDPSHTNLLFVYSDIVREHHVGDSMSNCLRAMPLRSGIDDVISTHTFSMPYYFPVRYGDIKNISILLTDETGSPLKFTNGRTFVTLHFRQRLYKARI